MKNSIKYKLLLAGVFLFIFSFCICTIASAQVDTSAITRLGITRSAVTLDSIDKTNLMSAARNETSCVHVFSNDPTFTAVIPKYHGADATKYYWRVIYSRQICTAEGCRRVKERQRMYEKLK